MIADVFVNWPELRPPLGAYSRCSPALTQLKIDMQRRWPGTISLGCHGVRNVRTGSVPSAHSWGAALDMSYRGVPELDVEGDVCPWLVAWSEEWGLQAIHDYQRGRIWRAGRTSLESDACSKWWKAQRPDDGGMGKPWADWLHLEVRPTRWDDPRPAAARGVT